MFFRFSRIPSRRPLTSYGERATSQLVRPNSASPVALSREMSRNHVNIARFYDWSEDLGTCVSVTKLYRNLSSVSRVTAEVRRPVNIQWCANGVRLTPGRMFARDKNALTKGEREIINGICRNRGYTRDFYDPPMIKSHQDAWLTGRQLGRMTFRRGECGDGVESTSYRTPRDQTSIYRRSLDSTSTELLSRVIQSASRNKTPGYYCIKGRPVTRSREDTFTDTNNDIPSAPPSTPDKILNSRPTVPPINNGQGATLIEDVKEAKQSSRKVRMDVFLPRITSEHVEEELEKASQYREARLAREQLIKHQEHEVDHSGVCDNSNEPSPRVNYSSSLDTKNVWENSVPISSSMCLHHRGNEKGLELDVRE